MGAARVGAGALRECLETLPPQRRLTRDLIDRADLLLAPLDRRMKALAAQDRFEEAAAVRDRAGVLSRAIVRQHRTDAVRAVPHLELRWRDHVIVARHGRVSVGPQAGPEAEAGPCRPDGPLPRQLADEITLLATWLEREASRVRLLRGSAGLSLPVGRVPGFRPAPDASTAPRPRVEPLRPPASSSLPATTAPPGPRRRTAPNPAQRGGRHGAAAPRPSRVAGAPARTTATPPSAAMRLFGVTPPVIRSR